MSGIAGWIGLPSPSGTALLDAMLMQPAANDRSKVASLAGPAHGAGAGGLAGTWGLYQGRGLIAALNGHPFWRRPDQNTNDMAAVAAHLLDAFAEQGTDALHGLHGDYAVALADPARGRVVLAVDRMSIRNIIYTLTHGGIVFGPTCDAVARHPRVRRDIDPQRLYDYLYFHMVPGPATVFRDLKRVPPGHCVEFEQGKCSVSAHWRPRFVEDAHADFATLKREFRDTLASAVRHYSAGANCGAFLSGGTDSSTISGLLGAATSAPAQTFSIGFDSEGFDEMHYARIAVSKDTGDQSSMPGGERRVERGADFRSGDLGFRLSLGR